MSLVPADNNQLQLQLSDTYAGRFRRCYGYVAEIKLSSTGRGATPCPYPNSWISTVPPKKFSDFIVSVCFPQSDVWYGLHLSPTQLQILSIFPWKFGDSTAELYGGFAFARIQAFASKAAFPTAAQRVTLGAPIVGFVEPSSGVSQSSQLTGWSVADLEEWRLTCPNTIPPRPM